MTPTIQEVVNEMRINDERGTEYAAPLLPMPYLTVISQEQIAFQILMDANLPLAAGLLKWGSAEFTSRRLNRVMEEL